MCDGGIELDSKEERERDKKKKGIIKGKKKWKKEVSESIQMESIQILYTYKK